MIAAAKQRAGFGAETTSAAVTRSPRSRAPLMCAHPECDFTTYDGDAWDLHQMDSQHPLYDPDEEPVDVCQHCGETRERVVINQASCTPEHEYEGDLPGPPGEHEWQTIARGELGRRALR